MRSWLKSPDLIKDGDAFGAIALFKSMVYDYKYANLDPIEKAVVSYVMVNYHQIGFREDILQDLKEISNLFIEENGTQIVSDVCTLMANPEIISEHIKYLTDFK